MRREPGDEATPSLDHLLPTTLLYLPALPFTASYFSPSPHRLLFRTISHLDPSSPFHFLMHLTIYCNPPTPPPCLPGAAIIIIDPSMGVERCDHCISIAHPSTWVWKKGSKFKYLKVSGHVTDHVTDLCKMTSS